MNKSSEYAVKVRIKGTKVQEAWGSGWRTIVECETNEQALFEIEKQLQDHDAQWSRGIKMRARWTCEICGELDKTLLESHHIKPRESFPELMHDLTNGRCLCMYHHAMQHTGFVRDHILARYALILHQRFNSGKVKEDRAEEAVHKR